MIATAMLSLFFQAYRKAKAATKIDTATANDGTRAAVTNARSTVVAAIRPTTPAATPSRKACISLTSSTASSRS